MCGILRNACICKCLWKFFVICCWHKAHYSCPSYFSVGFFFLIVFHGAHLELEVLCCVVYDCTASLSLIPLMAGEKFLLPLHLSDSSLWFCYSRNHKVSKVSLIILISRCRTHQSRAEMLLSQMSSPLFLFASIWNGMFNLGILRKFTLVFLASHQGFSARDATEYVSFC